MNKIDSKKAIIATIWSALGVYTNRFLSLGVAAVLSRLLTPDDFGTIAMITVISGFMNIFAEAGIGSVAVQFRKFEKSDHQTMFTLSLCLGVCLALILTGISSYVAIFFKNPDLKLIAMVMSLALPFSTLGVVPRGLLQRDMRFKEISIANIIASICAGFVGVIMAITGLGYWSLVGQTLVNSLISSCYLIYLSGLSPALHWNHNVIKKIYSYSGHLTLFSMINYWARNLDNLLIGKFIGSAPLGYYNRAYQLMFLPLSMLTGVIIPVLHSVLAERQNNIPAMYRGYIKVVKMIGLISIPGMTYAVIMSTELIHITWGNQWEQSIPIFSILGLNGIFQPIMSTTGTVFLARNKASWLFKCGVLTTLLLCLGIVSGLPFGIKGVAAGYTIASNITFIPLMYFVFVKLLNGQFIDFITIIKKPIIFTILFSYPLVLLSTYIKNSVPDVITILITLIISLIFYSIFLYKFEFSSFNEIKNFIINKKINSND